MSEPIDPEAMIAEARAELEKLRALSAELQAMADDARANHPDPIPRRVTSAANRCATLARYVIDCCHRAAYNPPERRKKRPAGWGFAWAQEQGERK